MFSTKQGIFVHVAWTCTRDSEVLKKKTQNLYFSSLQDTKINYVTQK